MVKPTITLTAALIIISQISTQSEEWTRFRGPNGSGKGSLSGIPKQITPADYNWAVRLDGFGHSSPVVWGDKIFITQTNSANTDGNERKVICFDGKTGDELWEWKDKVVKHNLHKHNNFASATPTIDSERVFLVWASGNQTEAVALSHSGGLIWRKQWQGFTSDHGHGTSPILVNDVLVFHTDSKDEKKSYVFGINPTDGEELWKLTRTTPENQKKHLTAYNSPCLMPFGDRELVVTLQSNDGWKGIDPEDGSVAWSKPGGYEFRSVGSISTTNNGIAFACFGSGGVGKQAEAIRVGDDGKVSKLYSLGIKDGLSYVPTPIIHDGLIFMWGDGGILTCRELESGNEVFRERIGGNFFSSPIFANDQIINISRSGELVVVAASNQFKIMSRSQLENNGQVHATPALSNNCLIVRTDTHLICIRGED